MPDAVVRAPAPVTELAPSDTASFEMITPSTTKSGWPAPRIDVWPGIATRPPPPGAPVFIEMIAPGTLPWSACSSASAGARFSSSLETWTGAVVGLRRSIVVACRVPPPASSLKGSSSSPTVTDDCDAGTATSLRWKSIARTRRRTSPVPTLMVKFPSAPDCATPRPPISTMVAPRTGVAPNVRVTLPVTCRAVACARTVAGIRHKAKSAAANTNVLRMPCLPFLDGCCRWNTLPRKYGGRSETPQPRGFSLRRLPFRSTAFRPNQNHAAPTPTPLELRRGAEQVRVDLDAKDLTGNDWDRLGLERGERIVDAVDEIHGRAVVAERGAIDPALAPLALDEHAGAAGPQV